MGRDARFNKERTTTMASNGIVFDALNRPLHEGDAVMLSTRSPMIFRVMKIAPVLDPSAPAGLLQLSLLCMATYTPKGGQALGEVMRIGESEEMGPMPLQMVDRLSDAVDEDHGAAAPAVPAGPRRVEG